MLTTRLPNCTAVGATSASPSRLLAPALLDSFARAMPVSPPRAAARDFRRCSMAVALLAIACGHMGDRAGTHGDADGRGTRIDSSSAHSAVEGVTPSPAPRAPAADSAAALDRAYQAERAIINGEAHALDTLPVAMRRSAAYAQRFDALRRTALHADSLRAARDRERKRAKGLGARG
jgi:hypothetical protein